ncbi:MAG TPA: trypsin-like peptidase domain-containing protein [Patescibacteria group bacterium]|nr:trypsin-like peptidase domain-containing protein [Patescibacteria group bacterium]
MGDIPDMPEPKETHETEKNKPTTFTPQWEADAEIEKDDHKSEKSERQQSKKELQPAMGPDHPKIRFLAMALLILISTAAGFAGGWLGQRGTTKTTIQNQQVVMKTQGQVISSIAKTVGNSVVSVNTTASVTTQNSFFGAQSSDQQGAGTGIILTEDGLIITNRHVVPEGTTKVSVTLADGTELDNVAVIGRTSANDSLDIAFIKVNDLKGKKLTPATLGNSSKMQVGDPVIAIGNALGQFQNTVTSGVLSGHGRSVQASGTDGSSVENLEDLFQTDAAINEGNSGGPLVNIDGQVIGINTAIAGNAQSIGFAIPINDVSGLIDSVKQTGKLQRPYIGVIYIPLTSDIAKQYNLGVDRGAYVAPADVSGTDPVISGSPADKAGIKAGDIITKLNDTAIDQNNSLSGLINKHKVGDKVTLTILRDGKDSKIDLTLVAAPTN